MIEINSRIPLGNKEIEINRAIFLWYILLASKNF